MFLFEIIKRISILLVLIIEVIKSQVLITSPKELLTYFKKKTGRVEIPANLANFGRIPYGYTTVI